jgi:hypothetical protein
VKRLLGKAWAALKLAAPAIVAAVIERLQEQGKKK